MLRLASAALSRRALARAPQRIIRSLAQTQQTRNFFGWFKKKTAAPEATPAAPQAAAPAAASADKMMCFQCEQTRDGKGCKTVGVCGKTPEVAALQDLLVDCMKGISQYAHRAVKLGARDKAVDQFMLAGLFTTVTNVNFDENRMVEYLKDAAKHRDTAKTMYLNACKAKGVKPDDVKGPANFQLANSTAELIAQGKKVSIPTRQASLGQDVVGIQEMTVYGLKGAAAYAEHAMLLGKESDKVYAGIHECLYNIVEGPTDVPTLLTNALKIGELNLNVMEMLDAGHTTKYGHPEPTVVNTRPVEGKCILVSGHDIADLELILQQTQGKNINVYTHGELLPACSYPAIKKYKHLKGNFGGAWQLQRTEFSMFPGAIVLTSNCLVEPRKSYADRIFTRRVVGWPGVRHVESNDFSEVIKAAQAAPGFTKEDVEDYPKTASLTTGFGRNTVMSVADKVVGAVKAGAIKHFFVVGGCDGAEGERSYFRDIAKAAPKDTVILTLGCGKYRFNSLPMGDIGGIPRVLDMGQCNDAYSAIQVAVALANAFKTDVNSLPLSFAVSWFEQKAVAVLLTLLHLGIKNIRLGPNLPGFATPAILSVLVEKFNIKPIGKVEQDMADMMNNK